MNFNWLLIMREWVEFGANICILLITIYTFYITFLSHHFKFLSISESSSLSEGESISVVVENRSFSTQVISKAALIINNQYKLLIYDKTVPIIIEPFSAILIETERCSYFEPDIGLIRGEHCVLEIQTSKGKRYAPFRKQTERVSAEMKNLHFNVSAIIKDYNGKIVPRNAKYSLVFQDGDEMKTVFIFATGVITEYVMGYNGIPREAVESTETLRNYLSQHLTPQGIEFAVKAL